MSSAVATDEGVEAGVTREEVEAQRRCVMRRAGRTKRFIVYESTSVRRGRGGGCKRFEEDEERSGGQSVFERAECAPTDLHPLN